MCPYRCINHVFNDLVEKMVDDLWSKKFPQTWKIIGISIWELNKRHDMGIQSLGDKENK